MCIRIYSIYTYTNVYTKEISVDNNNITPHISSHVQFLLMLQHSHEDLRVKHRHRLHSSTVVWQQK